MLKSITTAIRPHVVADPSTKWVPNPLAGTELNSRSQQFSARIWPIFCPLCSGMKRLPLFGLALATTTLFAQEPASPAPTTPAEAPALTESTPAEPVVSPAETAPAV